MSSRCAETRAALRCVLAAALLFLLSGCEREQRRFQAPALAPERNAWDVNEGKRLYRWFNCSGCHGSGGGGAYGPALSDGLWRYGGALDDIVATIRDGRPDGMPAFGTRLPDAQIRQLAAYVRSMSGQLATDVAPGRSDGVAAGEPESRREREPLRAEPPASGASR